MFSKRKIRLCISKALSIYIPLSLHACSDPKVVRDVVPAGLQSDRKFLERTAKVHGCISFHILIM